MVYDSVIGLAPLHKRQIMVHFNYALPRLIT